MRPACRALRINSSRILWHTTCRCYATRPPVTSPASKTPDAGAKLSQPFRRPPSVPQSDKRQNESRAHSQESGNPDPPSHTSKSTKGSRDWYGAPFIRRAVFWCTVAGLFWHVTPIWTKTVSGPSMAPTINPDCTSGRDTGYTKARVVVAAYVGTGSLTSRAAKGEQVASKYARGDIVMYKTPHAPEVLAIKRVVGVAGDMVTPLAGGSSEEPVVIPYNHIWVEGDAADRKKSQDSNAFGPISQQLVVGHILLIVPQLWNVFSWTGVASVSKMWPARAQNRVRENAVAEAANNPDHVSKFQEIEGGAGQDVIQLLRSQNEKLKAQFESSPEFAIQIKQFWTYSKAAARGHHDPATKVQAQEIVQLIESTFGREQIRAVSSTNIKRRRARGSQDALDIDAHLDEAIQRHVSAGDNSKLSV